MKAKWVIQKNFFSQDYSSEGLVKTLKSEKMDYKDINYIPFQDCLEEYRVYDDNDCVITYGSVNLIQRIQKLLWTPNVWFDAKTMECTTYYSYLGKFLMNQHYAFTTMGELKRNKHNFFKYFGSGDHIFIRPNSNVKEFNGKVIDKVMDLDKLSLYTLSPDFMLVVAHTKAIEAEWRLIIADGKVIAGSQYKKFGNLFVSKEYPDGATNLAESIANTWQPFRVFVVDIGYASHYGYGLVEIGSFNCAGLYACDKTAIIREVSKVASDEWYELNVL